MRTLWRILTRKKDVGDGVEQSSLARVLNTFDLTALGVGSTLGVGLYVLVGKVAKETAGPSVVLSFLIAAVASAFAGLCYAEFGARTPRAGSAYIYSYVCVGEFVAFIIGWNLILEYIIGSASVARGMTLYIDALTNNTITNSFRDIAPIGISFLSPYFDFLSFAIAIILSIGLAFGLKESSKANNVFTVLNLLVVLFVIIAGSTKADVKNWHLEPPANSTDAGTGGFFPFGISGMIKGAATCFYGFVGFDCIATTGEEAKNPQKAIPLAIVLSLLIVFVAYFSTATVVTLMVPYYLQDVNSPIPHAFDEFGWEAAKWVVTIGGIFALMASLFGAMFPLPRIIYAMANDGLIFRFLGKVSTRFSTPVTGTLLAGFLTGLMAAVFEQGQLIDMMSIGTLLAYTIVAACVMLLRYSVNEEVPEERKENANDAEVTCCGFVKQIFNVRKLSEPTKLSEMLVTIEIGFFCVLCLLMGFCAKYLIHDISQGVPYAIALPSVIGFFMIITLMSISTQPHSNRTLHFKVPFVPLIPALSILANIYLMMALDVTTWIRFGVWMAVGLPIYLFSAQCASKDARNACNGRINARSKKFSNGNTYTNAGYVDDEKMDNNNENSDSAFFEENESGDDKVENVVAVAPKKFDDRKMSVDTVSNCSNTVLHENVVALIHREDSRIVEEEEAKDDGLMLFNYMQDIVKDEEENLAYEADFFNAIDDINKVVEVEENRLSEAFNKTLPGDLPEAVKAAVQELEMVIEIEEGKMETHDSFTRNDEIVSEVEVEKMGTRDSLTRTNETAFEVQEEKAEKQDSFTRTNEDAIQNNAFVPPPPPPLPTAAFTPLLPEGAVQPQRSLYQKSPKKPNIPSPLPFIKELSKHVEDSKRKLRKTQPNPQITPAEEANDDIVIIKMGSEEQRKFSSKLQSLLTPASAKSETSKFKFENGTQKSVNKDTGSGVTIAERINALNKRVNESEKINARDFRQPANLNAVDNEKLISSLNTSTDDSETNVNINSSLSTNPEDNETDVNTHSSSNGSLNNNEARVNMNTSPDDNETLANRITSSNINTNNNEITNGNDSDDDEESDVAKIKSKLDVFLRSRLSKPVDVNEPVAKRRLSKTFPRNKDQLVHKEQMQQAFNSIRRRMLEKDTN